MPRLSKVNKPPSELYKNQPDMVNELNGFYYIHLHKKNVGRMYEGSDLPKGFSDNDIASRFARYKNQNMANAVVNQYMEGIQASIHQAGQYSNLIQNAFNTQQNGGQSIEILDKLHDVLEEGFKQTFDTSRVVALLQNEHKARWKGRGDDVRALQDLLDGKEGPGIKRGLDFLDTQLQGLADTVKLMENQTLGRALEQALIAATNQQQYSTPKAIGAALNAELNKDKYTKLNGSKISKDEVKAAVSMLQSIANYLENPSDKPLSADALKGLIQNQFYSTLAEFFWMRCKQGVTNNVFKETAKIVFAQTGQDNDVKIELVDPETGHYTGNYMKTSYFNETSKLSKASGKADGEAQNVTIGLESIFDDGEGYGDITLDLRISNKAYSTNHFGNDGDNLNTYNDVYGLGGGMNLGQGLDFTMASNINDKYLAYNVLCRNLNKNDEVHGGGFPNALAALQDALLTRNIVYLAAGRGKKDFSQLILLNGEIMSIWNIVKYVLSHDVGISASKLTSSQKQDSENHGIYLSLGDRDKIFDAVNEFDKIKRTTSVNQKIANKAMHLHIIPKKILTYASNLHASNSALLTK